MDNFWIEALLAATDGEKTGSRDGGSVEVLGYSDMLAASRISWLFNKKRKLDISYGCAEFLWYMGMSDSTTFLQKFAPSYGRFCEDGIHAFGAYGYRWRMNARINEAEICDDQLTTVMETLKLHPASRQAVMTMWDGTDLEHAKLLDKKDLPCTLTHQFLIRAGYLWMITSMRSNDAWMGLPYDVFCNTQIQKVIASELDVQVGPYVHNVGSLHVYDRHREKVEEILLSTKKSDLDVERPIARYERGFSSALGLRGQAKAAMSYVEHGDHNNLNGFNSVIKDSALACRYKLASADERPHLYRNIYCPQIKEAVGQFYGLC